MDPTDKTRSRFWQRGFAPPPVSPGIVRGLVRELVVPVVLAGLITSGINVFVAEARLVRGPSMQPNFVYDERVIVEKLSYSFREPCRGDVVILDLPAQEESLIKRVVALSGETVEVQGGHICIDGEPLQEHWTAWYGGPDHPATLVPAGQVFVLGDNRGSSRDSRSFGPVALDRIIGRVRFIYWPLDHLGWVR